MYPMISSLDELRAANAQLELCQAELRREGIPFDESMEVGMMVEVPAAALIASDLAREVDFFSLGTNDLTQYTLAVDRLNQRVAHLHAPTHPGVVRLIRMTVQAAREQGLWVGVCGEAAGDPDVIPLLVGLGVDELSATPAVVPAAKFLLRRLKRTEAVALAESVLKCGTAAEILAASRSLARECAPELFSAA
jgi:phosphotransferase system enzyme I (PtsI)